MDEKTSHTTLCNKSSHYSPTGVEVGGLGGEEHTAEYVAELGLAPRLPGTRGRALSCHLM